MKIQYVAIEIDNEDNAHDSWLEYYCSYATDDLMKSYWKEDQAMVAERGGTLALFKRVDG